MSSALRGTRPLLFLLLVACSGGGHHEQPDAPSVVDAPPDDGFGQPCTETPNSFMEDCTSTDGMPGWCAYSGSDAAGSAVFLCRRPCTGHYTGCPPGQVPIPIVGDNCYCRPAAPTDAGVDSVTGA